MKQRVKLNRLHAVLADLSYPLDPTTAATACEDVTVVLADGQVSLSETVRGSTASRFDTVTELEEEIMGLLPRQAVGEPYQSDGDA